MSIGCAAEVDSMAAALASQVAAQASTVAATMTTWGDSLAWQERRPDVDTSGLR